MNKMFLTASSLLFAVVTMAQAEVTISSTSLQEISKSTPSGEPLKTWVKAEKIVPDTVVKYLNTLQNSGTQTATQLVVKNSIPKNMEYVANSAKCQSSCKVAYSVDGGATFMQSSELFVGVGEARHLAKASEYTDIMWQVESLGANSQSAVEYQARLK